MYSVGLYSINTSDMRQSKASILSTNVDLRSLETEFLIAVCSPPVNYSLQPLIWIGLATYSVGLYSINLSDMRQSKTFILSTT